MNSRLCFRAFLNLKCFHPSPGQPVFTCEVRTLLLNLNDVLCDLILLDYTSNWARRPESGCSNLNQSPLILVRLLHTITLENKMKKFYEDISQKSIRC